MRLVALLVALFVVLLELAPAAEPVTVSLTDDSTMAPKLVVAGLRELRLEPADRLTMHAPSAP